MEAFRRGTQHYNDAEYESALGAFQEAASLYASPDFQYNIGLCYEKLDKPAEAIRAFEVYLRTKPEATDRANVRDRIARLEQRKLELEEEAREARAQETAPPPRIEPQGAADTPDEPSIKPHRPLIISGGALLGVGGLTALVGGIAFGVLARQRSDEVQDVLEGGNPDALTLDETRELEDEGERFEVGQISTVAVGASIAIVGSVLLAIGLKRRAENQATASVSPVLGPTRAGLAITGRF